MLTKKIHEDYLRSVIFGFQDALVSTTGAIAGVAAGSQDKNLVILTGVVVITVEALSMAIGQYQSEKSVHQMDTTGKHTDNLFVGAGLMGGSYFLGGLVPLMPIIFLDLPVSYYMSVVAAMIGLFVLGFLKAKLVKVNPWSSAIEILILGSIASLIGIMVGTFFRIT